MDYEGLSVDASAKKRGNIFYSAGFLRWEKSTVIHAILNFVFRHWEFFASTLIALLGISAYGVYTRSKDHLILDINNTLQDCRALESWDDRSELKLFSWIDGDERDLHKKSIMQLRKIRKDIIHYYRIHEEMRDGEPFGAYQSDSF